MLILTSGQVFHALKTVSLLVTASGIIGATKIRPNFKNNCNAQTKKKTIQQENGDDVYEQTNEQIRIWGIQKHNVQEMEHTGIVLLEVQK